MTKILERIRGWLRRGAATEPGDRSKESTAVGETHRPSGAIGHGSAVPPNYVSPSDEGRPPH